MHGAFVRATMIGGEAMRERLESLLRRFTVRQRMLAILLILLLPLAVLSAVSMVVLNEQETAFRDTVEESVHALIPLTTLEYYLQQALVDEMLAESSDRVPDFAHLTNNVDRSFSRIQLGADDRDIPRNVLDQAHRDWLQARPSVRRLVEQVHARRALDAKTDARVRKDLEDAIADVSRARSHLSDVLRARYRRAAAQRSGQLHWLLWSWVITLAVAGLLATLFLRSLLRPVRALARAAQQVQHGETGVRVEVRGRDELAVLGECFNRMSSYWEATRESLQTEATRDALTGVLNRRGIMACLHAEVERHRALGRPLSLFAMDLDRFKMINDHYGHSTGDRALEWIAGTLRGMLREPDHLGRYGGDEFIAALPETGHEEAVAIARRIHAAVLEASRREDVRPGLSIGVATLPDDGDSVQALMDVADARLYAQKRHRGAWQASGAGPGDEPGA